MFSKQLFDTLPEPKEWDYVVELIPGSKPTGCKIYPLSPTEQKELDIVRGHPPNPVSITKSDNCVSAPALTSIPTPYIPPHRRVHFKIPL